MMNTLKTLLSLMLLMSLAIVGSAQDLSDKDLLFTELYNAEFPTDEGTISLVDGISGDYELLNYNVLGDLDENEGRDAVVLLTKNSDEGRDYYLYAVMSQESFPVLADYEYLGRDLVILNLNIVEGEIRVEYAARGEGETIETVLEIRAWDGTSLVHVYEGAVDEGRPFVADDILSIEELGNITYTLDWFDYPVSLLDGEALVVIGNTEESWDFTYSLDAENIAYGDLNGDGAEDALVYIAVHVEGYEDENWVIAAVLNNRGLPEFADSEVDRMGSGTRLEALSIAADGVITFNFTDLTHQQLVENRFILEAGTLVRQ